MRATAKILLAGFVIAVTLFGLDASATFLLPDSSYYEGSTYYDFTTDDGFLRGRIDFAVYDTLGGNEFLNAGYEAPGDGQFIYVYQIFNDYPLSDEAVAYFTLLGISETAIDAIGSEDPGSGVEPSDAYCALSEAVWEFDDGLIYAGEHSWFLILTSNNGWVPGEYEIKMAEDSDLPVPDVPEPATFAMFAAAAGAIILKKRKNSAR